MRFSSIGLALGLVLALTGCGPEHGEPLDVGAAPDGGGADGQIAGAPGGGAGGAPGGSGGALGSGEANGPALDGGAPQGAGGAGGSPSQAPDAQPARLDGQTPMPDAGGLPPDTTPAAADTSPPGPQYPVCASRHQVASCRYDGRIRRKDGFRCATCKVEGPGGPADLRPQVGCTNRIDDQEYLCVMTCDQCDFGAP